jgi:alpha,alpha-trehalose-phosphate synthase [UDP-forming]
MLSIEQEKIKDEKKIPAVLVDKRLLPERFLLVSNRLPYQIDIHDDDVTLTRGVGGLVTALDPIMHHTGGTWIGWSGSYEDLPERMKVGKDVNGAKEYNLKPMCLSRKEIEDYYLGYSNKSLWPLFHYFQEHCEFNGNLWQVYKQVNRRFADAVISEYRDGDLVWVHDYHLMLVPAMLREALPDAKIGFFLHIPFPDVEVFMVEPQAEELVSGLLGADLVGFHIDSYASKFLDAVSKLTDYRYSRSEKKIRIGDRVLALGSFPISIDFNYFADVAAREETYRKAKDIRDYYRADIIAVGVDRLDYTKGILERLQAVETMLERHPDLQGRFTFVQVSAPSRTKLHTYREMREQVEMMVGRINGRFSSGGCIPVDYHYNALSQEELVAYYRASDLALITPLRDGMNLIAKEYVASQADDAGALILSRFTGAFSELKDAFIVNPYDLEAMAERIYKVIRTPKEEKQRRMHKMRDVVRRNDIFWWLERFLRELD